MTILKDKITLLCGAQIKNRICKAAMTERIAFLTIIQPETS